MCLHPGGRARAWAHAREPSPPQHGPRQGTALPAQGCGRPAPPGSKGCRTELPASAQRLLPCALTLPTSCRDTALPGARPSAVACSPSLGPAAATAAAGRMWAPGEARAPGPGNRPGPGPQPPPRGSCRSSSSAGRGNAGPGTHPRAARRARRSERGTHGGRGPARRPQPREARAGRAPAGGPWQPAAGRGDNGRKRFICGCEREGRGGPGRSGPRGPGNPRPRGAAPRALRPAPRARAPVTRAPGAPCGLPGGSLRAGPAARRAHAPTRGPQGSPGAPGLGPVTRSDLNHGWLVPRPHRG